MTIFTTLTVSVDDVDEVWPITGWSLLRVEHLGQSDYSFALDAEVATGLDELPTLLERLADRLPRADFLIATDPEGLFAAIDRSAALVPAPVAAHLRTRLERVKRARAVDLSLPRQRMMLDQRGRGRKMTFEPPIVPFALNRLDAAAARARMRSQAAAEWCRFLRAEPVGAPGLGGRMATVTFLATSPELAS